MASDVAHDLRSPQAFDSTALAATPTGDAGLPGRHVQIALVAQDRPAQGARLDEPALHLVAPDRLHPNRLQPRRVFDETALRALADSIEAEGVLQPIMVRPHESRNEHYEIIAGERRWRAALMAGVEKVPVIVRAAADRAALGLALVENLQRRDLSPMETAEGYDRLMKEFGYAQDELARAVSKSRSQVANTLRLLGLPQGVRKMLDEGRLSAGHARALLGAERPDELACQVVSRGLSVRQTERLARRRAAAARGAGEGAARGGEPSLLATLERDLAEILGLRVSVEPSAGGGAFTIHCDTLNEVEHLLRRLKTLRGQRGDMGIARAARGAGVTTVVRNVDVYGPAPTPLPQADLAAATPLGATVAQSKQTSGPV